MTSTSREAPIPSSPTSRAATAASAFSSRRDEVQQRLRQGPAPCPPQPAPDPDGAEAAPAAQPDPAQPVEFTPTHWTLGSIRAAFDWMAGYSLSGVWRVLDRLGLKLRSAKVQHFSPDPEYQAKLVDLEMALWEARRFPGEVEAVFIDEMGFARWPEPTADYGGEPAVADRMGANNGLWRLIGGLNALTGRVDYLDNYIVGRAKVIEFYSKLVQAYPQARQLYVIQDNWSIHKNPEVLEALQAWPQVQPVWLPTYAPWLNPIEKLWRWLKQDVLKMHRLADDWKMLRGRVRSWLDQFEGGSPRLLEYVGLLGGGLLARMIHGT